MLRIHGIHGIVIHVCTHPAGDVCMHGYVGIYAYECFAGKGGKWRRKTRNLESGQGGNLTSRCEFNRDANTIRVVAFCLSCMHMHVVVDPFVPSLGT